MKVGISQIVKDPHPVVGKDQHFIPHFNVSKQKADGSIGIRVVYDGSCPTSNGIALNEVMLMVAICSRHCFQLYVVSGCLSTFLLPI